MPSPERWTEMFDPGLSEKVLALKSFLEKPVKCQPKAIGALCKMYQYDLTLRCLEERQGPLGVFMFLGPSGVGKTELARVLAKYFMGSDDSLIKIDCSSFSQPHMIHSLIGAPHGYIGYNEQPFLSEQNLLKKIKKQEHVSRDPIADRKMDLLGSQKRLLLARVKIIKTAMTGMEEDFDIKTKFAQALSESHQALFEPKADGKSVIDLLRNRETREALISLLTHSARIELENNLSSIEDASLLIELNLLIRRTIFTYRESETKLVRLIEELRVIDEKLSSGDDDKDKEKENKREPERRLVILFDEIEKANPTLHQLLLQVMEDGKLTLANGSTTNLRNAFVIMTSNVGSKAIGDILRKRGIGFRPSPKGELNRDLNELALEEVEKRILQIAEKEMEKTFKPEFRRRIDETVVFRPLSKTAFYEILGYQIEIFCEALALTEVRLLVDREVRDFIISQSLHRSEVGASLLTHKFKSIVKIPLGRILSGQNFKGTIRVAMGSDGKVKFLLKE